MIEVNIEDILFLKDVHTMYLLNLIGTRDKLRTMSHSLDKFFSTITLPGMVKADKQKGDIPFVYCSDLPGLVTHLVDIRKISYENLHLKVM